MGRKHKISCHGDERRFAVLAEFIADYFGKSVKYIADIAGGQGVLSRLLTKKYNYEAEVVDPRHYALVGVKHREALYTPDMAAYYDLIVGLHPDAATRPVAGSDLIRPTGIVPCCNYWDKTRKLNSIAIADEIGKFYGENGVSYQRFQLDFSYPNICLVSAPPAESGKSRKHT